MAIFSLFKSKNLKVTYVFYATITSSLQQILQPLLLNPLALSDVTF